MGVNFAFNWELQLIEWLQSAGGSVGAALASFFTLFGEEIILVAILAFLYLCWDKEFGEYIGVMIVTGLVANTLLKNVVLRRRPYFDHKRIKCLKPVSHDGGIRDIAAQGYSFPSGHSTNSAIAYGGMLTWLHQHLDSARKRKLAVIFGVGLPLLVGISRFMLGVHYPTDVLVGWLLGIVVIVIVSWLERKVSRRWLLHLVMFLVSSLGILYCQTDDYYTGLGLMGGMFLALEFEKRYVQFENTRAPLASVVRIVCAFAVYMGLNALLKLPFPSAFLEANSLPAHLVRTVRYLIVSFVTLGIYPMAFKWKLFANPAKKEEN